VFGDRETVAYAYSELIAVLEGTEFSNCCRRGLVSQEARLQEQLTELTVQLTARDNEFNKLRYQMEDLQRDVLIKSSGMDREYLNWISLAAIRKVPLDIKIARDITIMSNSSVEYQYSATFSKTAVNWRLQPH
jgi:hypothetical protein